jgi:hypothetical protein
MAGTQRLYSTARPLQKIRVLDMSRVLAGIRTGEGRERRGEIIEIIV